MAGPSSHKVKKGQNRERPSRSRNTTPVSASSASVLLEAKSEQSRRTLEPSIEPYLQTSFTHPPHMATVLSDTPIMDTFENNISSSSSLSVIPSASELSAIVDSIRSNLLPILQAREEASDKLLRELAQKQKDRSERDRQKALERIKLENEARRIKKSSTPRKKDKDDIRPMAVGAHGIARQDGKDAKDVKSAPSSKDAKDSLQVKDAVYRAPSSDISSIASHPPTPPDITMKDADNDQASDSEESQRQPPPSATIEQFQVFGDDPSSFPDPTIYEILPVTDDMTEDQKKAIYSVARYPRSDLTELTPGVAPDKDFSNAKPSNQVAAQTFLNFVEPYLRPNTQEDLGFLQERQDRNHVFAIPKRGARHYKEIWAEEDGTMFLDGEGPKFPTNEPRGSIDLMNDDVAESDEVSTGPTTARLLALARPLTRPIQEDPAAANGLSTEMEVDGEAQNDSAKTESQPPATSFPESTWKNFVHTSPDYATLDSRILEELRHIGFLSPTDMPNYTDVQDDEVTARLRYLQRELRQVSLINGARKARILEIASERMAVQEWQGISDDLDSQLNQAYNKRSRNSGKGKKQIKRPGVAAPAGVARPGGGGVGEPIRSLMERRDQWNNLIGPVVDMGKVSIPKETIFDEENMSRLMKAEQESWVEDADDV